MTTLEKLTELRNSLQRSIDLYDKQTVSADEMLEFINLVIESLEREGNDQI